MTTKATETRNSSVKVSRYAPSGAMNGIVPLMRLKLASIAAPVGVEMPFSVLLQPKSASFTTPVSLMRMFAPDEAAQAPPGRQAYDRHNHHKRSDPHAHNITFDVTMNDVTLVQIV